MACTLVSIDPNVCLDSDGGIFQTQITDFANIVSLVIDSTPGDTFGTITDIVMTGPSLWETYTFDDDDEVAFYNQTGVRTNNKHTFTQAAFYKFDGVDNNKIQFVNGIKGCCALVAIHRFRDGTIALVQGIDITDVATAAFTVSK